VTLPTQSPSSAGPDAIPMLPAELPRVLVVDDEPRLRQVLVRLMTRDGFACTEADNGVQALALLEADGPPPLILSDLRMPDMDGAELLRLCTIDGARALGLQDTIGTLEPEKDADLCAVSLAAPHVRPVHDPQAAIFHAARGCDVVMTMVQGRALYRDGRLATLDPAALEPAVEDAAARLRQAMT